jgi:hypothetical protein
MKVTPEYIASLINYQSNGVEWNYNPEGKDMRNLQVKGSARVFNLLEEHKLALLADEVGMGKTIQSLSVCAALWNQKPTARILVLVPRDEIAKNWEKEYMTFVRHHYRNNDDIVKTVSGQLPVKKMIFTTNLYALTQEVQQDWGQFFIGKISSFSCLMAGDKSIERLRKLGIGNLDKAIELSQEEGMKYNEELMRLIREEILSYSTENEPYFDLIIIDEAHYLRRKDGNSLRVNAATTFFGEPGNANPKPITDKVLLLTATPNHSSSKDIGKIISYFSNKFDGQDYADILKKICVRRLRRLSSRGLNKYNYRKEIASQSNFNDNPLSEMFFALYQHELAKEVHKNKSLGQGGKGISRMMKYLEGVEFIPHDNEQIIVEETDEESKLVSSDFSNGSDADLLLGISRKFKEVFDTDPKHPKYDKLVDDLTIKHTGEKVVVFVRRIPSVFEIAKRIMSFYDMEMWSLLQSKHFSSLNYNALDRKSFISIAQKSAIEETIQEENTEEKEIEESLGNIPQSKVLGLFKIIKNDPNRATDAAYFRLRFSHSKPSIFSIFFSPGEDYYSKSYGNLTSYRFNVGNKELENYYNSCLIHRTSKLKNNTTSKDIQSILLTKNPVEHGKENKLESFPTLITLFLTLLTEDTENKSENERITSTYLDFDYYEREAFSNFIEKGTLLASQAVVWMYDIYRRVQSSENRPLIQYVKFCELVKLELKEQRLFDQLKESVLHFRTIYTKVFSINGQVNLLEESWDSFNNAQPIYPYNADNSNQKVLRCFNTPFYPDFLVATSVLQEGVNLQYFCNTIYHYGMAWTPGDNEQRIGRIDRMFSKIERKLEKEPDSNLNIYYPYLKDTIDEEQLSRFVKRKYNEETLIDKGTVVETAEGFSIEETENENWGIYLRIPEKNEISDPYPALIQDFKGIKPPIIDFKTTSLNDFYNAISSAITELDLFKSEVFFIDQNENQKLLIDPSLSNKRKQPVIAELLFDAIGTGMKGKSVYCLRMRTPLAAMSKLKNIRQNFINNNFIQSEYDPGIKLCLDQTQTSGSIWGIYMACELPLFIEDFKINPLSKNEIQDIFIRLVTCADLTEIELFKQDITKEVLNLPTQEYDLKKQLGFRSAKQSALPKNWVLNGAFITQEITLDNITFYDIEKQSLLFNHSNLYVKAYFDGLFWKAQIAHTTKDPNPEEFELMEKHLKVFKSNLNL